MMYIVILACLSVCLAGPLGDPAWTEYKEKFGKVYGDVEDAIRYKIWKENMEDIERHNSEYASTYQQGHNQFTDMTDEEFELRYGCMTIPEEYLNGSIPSGGQPFVLPAGVSVPDSINWVQKGAVTNVKNQASCGSCYTFSATGALEAQWFKKTGNLISLSEQQMLDCSTQYGNMGCRGGWYHKCWQYIRDIGGSQTEQSYPYTQRQGYCRFNSAYVAAHVSNYVNVGHNDEGALKTALGTAGPVAVAIDATLRSFRNYKHGVYYDRSCSSSRLNHAVLAVGYGNEGGYDYWLIKNSWGTWFGASGYIKILRNYYNHCGVATNPKYPVV